MADLSTKKDPLHLRRERPPYVDDTSGPERDDVDAPPAVGTDPSDVSSAADSPQVSPDPEAVEHAERGGKGL